MRAKEFINEGGTGSLISGVADAIPSLNVLPGLENQDVYKQYRYGVALAAARAAQAGDVQFDPQSVFGEKMIVVARDDTEEETIALALQMIGQPNNKRLISTSKSTEAADVNTKSPCAPQYKTKRASKR
jgi:hypothetical protein